jgi:hypothetical protein
MSFVCRLPVHDAVFARLELPQSAAGLAAKSRTATSLDDDRAPIEAISERPVHRDAARIESRRRFAKGSHHHASKHNEAARPVTKRFFWLT